MSFTYTPGGSSRDDVRLLIGDVDENAQVDERLEDEDIDRLLALEPTLRLAAAQAADILSAKYARKGEGAQAPTVKGSSRAQELRATAARLRARAAQAVGMFVGGISRAARDVALADTDRLAPAFSRGMLDDPDAGAA